MLQFYKLDEAANMLGISPDDLKKMAQQGEIHFFTDKGSMRFRAQEIEELARRRGRGSDPELQIVDPAKRAAGDADDEAVQIGQEVAREGSSSGGKKSGSKSGKPGSKSPPPKPGSDSDVRLVADGSEVEFQVADSARGPKGQAKPDSGVRILPLEVQSDSDVKIVPEGPEDSDVVIGGRAAKSGSDSDVRVVPEQGGKSGSSVRGKGKAGTEFVTEEIDLDAEEAKLRHAESSQRLSKKPTKAAKPEAPKKTTEDSSSDFDLTPASAKDQSPLELNSDEVVSLGEPAKGAAGDSGINLKDPVDSGISLEKGGDAVDFEVTAEGAHVTPKPAKPEKEDSSSDFELSLDAEGSSGEQAAASPADSDSEFELTLEDSGLMPLEEKKAPKAAKGEEDIFETDFEVPALDEDSGSEAVALDESDTDLESSDFDLALDEQDAAGAEESGSEVVALEDEEEAEPGASTVARPRKKPARAAREEEEIEEEEEVAAVGAVAAAPAEWGVLPALVLIPSVLVMFFVTLVGFEMVRGVTGYQTGMPVAAPVAKFLANDVFGQTVP